MERKFNISIPVVAVRIILFGLILVSVAHIISLEAFNSEAGDKLYGEGSMTEYMQIGFLFLSAVLFSMVGLRFEDKRSFAILLVGICLVACIREFDNVLDHYVFDGAWQALALITAVVIAFWVYKLKATLYSAIVEFMNQPGFGMVVSGFLVVFTFSRMFGRKVFWKAVMSENYIRSVKNVAEEGIELLGYALIFLGVVEYFMFCLNGKKEISDLK